MARKRSRSSTSSTLPEEVIEYLKNTPGIGQSTISSVAESGLSVYKIALMEPDELAKIAGIRTSLAAIVIKAVRDYLGLGFRKGYEVYNNIEKITTGSRALDDLLGGGVETGDITEFFGPFGSGKTQICHQLSVNVQLPKDRGGLSRDGDDVRVLYIDTEGTFSRTRIVKMAERWGLDPDRVLGNIYVARAINSSHQMSLIDDAFDLVKEEGIRLIIVDSVTSHFRAEYPGRDKLAERQQKLNMHLHTLKLLAFMTNAAVVVTNQVMARPDVFYGDPTQPVGGHVLGHAPRVRVEVKRLKGNRRRARIIDAPHLPEAEAEFIITDYGISDVE